MRFQLTSQIARFMNIIRRFSDIFAKSRQCKSGLNCGGEFNEGGGFNENR
jgi:hypothetical protein